MSSTLTQTAKYTQHDWFLWGLQEFVQSCMMGIQIQKMGINEYCNVNSPLICDFVLIRIMVYCYYNYNNNNNNNYYYYCY